MWNVFGYCKDYINDKVNDKEFIDIYFRQHQLKDFISDMQKELDKNKSSVIIIQKYIDSKEYQNLKNYIKELVTSFENNHK